uniref:Sema domain-containing protein n=1 Tax=Oryzias latipes TaxID=8090 RepID=A0A3P9L9V0_ORYLA
MLRLFCLYFSFFCAISLSETDSKSLPRMVFKETETGSIFKRFPLQGHEKPVKIIADTQPGIITSVGQTHLTFFNFQSSEKTPPEQKVVWEECKDKGCEYNISVVQRNGRGSTFLCGSSRVETKCCEMDLTANPTEARCYPSERLQHITQCIKRFITKEGEHSLFIESGNHTSLYMTSSGFGENVGIHRFGSRRLAPQSHNKEQHFVGLMLSRREDSLQNRIYAFYKQKNQDTDLYSDEWIPFVSQICLADVGGPKNLLQNKWTSQMNARLFCGDPERKVHFSELVHVATVDADRWEESKVYALFRNEWGVSAVCMYTVADIHEVFMKSSFKEPKTESKPNRPRECVLNSYKLDGETLNNIKEVSEMEQWVKPVKNSLPLLVYRHHYTGIYVDASQHSGNSPYTVIFLSLAHGGIHKVLQTENDTFLISEYRPFDNHTHIGGFFLHPPSSKLYVSSIKEVVEVDVVNCEHYGNSCEDCVLSRDPYCGWNNNRCTAETRDPQQKMISGNYKGCSRRSRSARLASEKEDISKVVLPSGSRYFLQCPVSSLHAEYTWVTPNSRKSCSPKEDQCLLLIESMSSQYDGDYECSSEEMGYSKKVVQYQLRSTAPGRTVATGFVWVCVAAALMGSFSW